MEENVATKIDTLKASPSFQKVLNSDEYRDLKAEVKKRNFVHLVQNMIVLSSMRLMPMKHAIGRVMTQLTGADKPLVGPADAATAVDISQLTLDNLKRAPLYSATYKNH